jgi:hypothetical protein
MTYLDEFVFLKGVRESAFVFGNARHRQKRVAFISRRGAALLHNLARLVRQ